MKEELLKKIEERSIVVGVVGLGYKGASRKSIPELSERALSEADLVVVTCAHTSVDYELVQRSAKLIFDTKNVMKNVKERGNIEVL